MGDTLSFSRIPPSEGQANENSCWAACLCWWLKAMANGRPSWTQKEIMTEYWKAKDTTGGMRPDSMITTWANDTRLKMATCVWPTPNVDLYSLPLGRHPVLIAFKHISGFSHMNVIWPLNGTVVYTMEPFFPLPGQDGKRTGRILQTDLGDYNFGDNVVLAWGRPSDGRITTQPDQAS